MTSTLNARAWLAILLPLVACSQPEPIKITADVSPPEPVPTSSSSPGDNPSGSRLKQRFLDASDGARHPVGDWWDSERGERCQMQQTTPTEWRCLPITVAEMGRYFADSVCTKPLISVPTALLGCHPYDYATLLTHQPPPACYPESARVFRVGAETQLSYRSLGGVCEPFSDPGVKLFSVGVEVPLTAFVVATLETDK